MRIHMMLAEGEPSLLDNLVQLTNTLSRPSQSTSLKRDTKILIGNSISNLCKARTNTRSPVKSKLTITTNTVVKHSRLTVATTRLSISLVKALDMVKLSTRQVQRPAPITTRKASGTLTIKVKHTMRKTTTKLVKEAQ